MRGRATAVEEEKEAIDTICFINNLCLSPQLLFPNLFTSSTSTLINSFILLTSPSCPAVDSIFAFPGAYVNGVNAMLNKAWELASSEGWGLSLVAVMGAREGPKLFEQHGFKSHGMWQDLKWDGEFMMTNKDPPAPMSLGDRRKPRVEK
jgi:hypothetical protein